MNKEKDSKKKRKLPTAILMLIAASVLLLGISSFSDASIMKIYGPNGSVNFYINDSSTPYVGIGTENPLAALDVNGTILMNGSTVCTAANGLCSGSGGAPANAQYITLATDATLTNERVITPGAGILLEDFGAGAALRINTTATVCTGNELSYWTGTAWLCKNSTGGGGGTGDIEGVIAGTGLLGGGTSGNVTITANTTYLQRRVNETCATGSSIRVINDDGTVTCETDSTGSNNYPESITVQDFNNNTYNISIERNGLSNISAFFTTRDTNDTAALEALSIFAQTKASTGTGTCIAGTAAQNITLTNNTLTWQCVPVSGNDGNNYTTSIAVTGTTTKTLNLTFLTGSLVTSWIDNYEIAASNLYNNITNLQISNSTVFNRIAEIYLNTTNINNTLTNAIALLQFKGNSNITSIGLQVINTTGVTVQNTPLTANGNLILNFLNSSASSDGLLRSTDFTTFNNKAGTGTANCPTGTVAQNTTTTTGGITSQCVPANNFTISYADFLNQPLNTTSNVAFTNANITNINITGITTIASARYINNTGNNLTFFSNATCAGWTNPLTGTTFALC